MRNPKKVHVLHPTRVSSFTDVTTHCDENNHYSLTISTMADSGPPGAENLPLDICVESPHQDGLNDTMEVTEEVELSLLEYLSRSVTSSPGVTE
jgi:hypothetical protein